MLEQIITLIIMESISFHWIRRWLVQTVIFFKNPVERIVRVMAHLKSAGFWDDSDKSNINKNGFLDNSNNRFLYGPHTGYPNRKRH